MESDDYYKEKYLKYKQKYLNLRDQTGGIAFTSGEYIFFFDSDRVKPTLKDKTTILYALENLTKETEKKGLETINNKGILKSADIGKITDEIGSRNGGWYYKKVSGETHELKQLEGMIHASKRSAATGAKATRSAVTNLAVSAHEYARCEVCETQMCKNYKANKDNKDNKNTHKGGAGDKAHDPINIKNIDLIKKINDKSTLIDDDIVNGLYKILYDNGIEVTRAIICRVGTRSKVHKYKKFEGQPKKKSEQHNEPTNLDEEPTKSDEVSEAEST